MVKITVAWLLAVAPMAIARYMHCTLWHYREPWACAKSSAHDSIKIISHGKCRTWAPAAANIQMQWNPGFDSQKSEDFGECSMTFSDHPGCIGNAYMIDKMQQEARCTNKCPGPFTPGMQSARIVCNKK
ncbi:hypothetical protein LTR95_004491 [Oleoguttula sp. CCFEE 5521]